MINQQLINKLVKLLDDTKTLKDRVNRTTAEVYDVDIDFVDVVCEVDDAAHQLVTSLTKLVSVTKVIGNMES